MVEESLPRSERSRIQILSAAHELFRERGYSATSMRQIADKADIALGGIYNHFASKEDIFFAVLMEYHPFFVIVPAIHEAKGENLETFFRDMALRMVNGLDDRLDFLNLILIELVEFDGQHVPELFLKFYPDILVFVQRIQSYEGQLKDIPLLVLTRAFLGMFISFVITKQLIGKQMPPEMDHNGIDYFVEIFLHGVLAEKNNRLDGCL